MSENICFNNNDDKIQILPHLASKTNCFWFEGMFYIIHYGIIRLLTYMMQIYWTCISIIDQTNLKSIILLVQDRWICVLCPKLWIQAKSTCNQYRNFMFTTHLFPKWKHKLWVSCLNNNFYSHSKHYKHTLLTFQTLHHYIMMYLFSNKIHVSSTKLRENISI